MDEEEKKKSSLDRVNGLYNSYQNARALYSLAKKASAMGRMATLAATSEVWGPILIVIVIVLVFTFLVVLGSQGNAASEIPSPTQSPTPSETSGFFNPIGATPEELLKFNSIIAEPLSFPKYKSLLTETGPITITFSRGQPDCGARVYNRDQIIFLNFSLCGNDAFKKYMIIHETGHIIDARNGRIGQSFDYPFLLGADPQCFSSDGYLKSYPYADSGSSPRGTARDESFAEAVSSFLISTPNNHSFTSFKTQCPDVYNWVANNIYQ